VIPKGGESRHLIEIPLGRKVANHMNKSTKEATQKPIKTNYPPDLLHRLVFLYGWVFLANFSAFLVPY